MVAEDYYVNFLWANFCSASIFEIFVLGTLGQNLFNEKKGPFQYQGQGCKAL